MQVYIGERGHERANFDPTSFPGSLILPPGRVRRDGSLLTRPGGKMRDPGNEVDFDQASAILDSNSEEAWGETKKRPRELESG